MFRSLKAKLVSVKTEVSASIRSVSDAVSGSRTSDIDSSAHKDSPLFTPSAYPPDVSSSSSAHSNAAQELLHRYELTWEEMCLATQSNVQKAKVVAKDVHSLQNSSTACAHKVDEFKQEMNELPSLLNNIEQITHQIVDLHSQCALIEDSLVVLQNLCEKSDFEKARKAEYQRLSRHEATKRRELATYSEKLSNEHRRKVTAIELREVESRREKELFYQKAFEEDIRRFKAEQTHKQAKDNLASVKLEPDDEEAKILDNFLNGDEGVASAKGGELVPSSDSSEVTSVVNHSTVVKERSYSDASVDNKHMETSSDSLEWDENGDTIDIVTNGKELENSLEMEIDNIRLSSCPEPTSKTVAEDVA